MILRIFGHDFHYECENLCRVYYPNEKINIVYGDDDMIYVNKDYVPVVDKVATYRYDNIEITKISKRFIEANIYTSDNELVEVTLIKENNEWRLDSITC